MGQWLLYSTTPNVITLLTQKSQAKIFALIFLLKILPGHCLGFNVDQKTGFQFPLTVSAHNNV